MVMEVESQEFDSYDSSDVHLEPEPRKPKRWPWVILFLIVIVICGWAVMYYMEQAQPAVQPEKPVVTTPSEPEATEAAAETEGLVLNEEHQEFNRYFTAELLQTQLTRKSAGWDLSMFRELVKTAITAEFLTDMPGMTWEKWETTRKSALELARHLLSQPEFITWLWDHHGTSVVQAVKHAEREKQVTQWLERTLPFFNGALPVGESRALSDYYRVDRQLEQELKKDNYDAERIRELTIQLDQHYRVLTGLGLDRDDIYLFEFSRRRLQEGGRDLLTAYARIIERFRQDLTSEPEAATEDTPGAGS